MFKAEVKEEDPDGDLINLAAVNVKDASDNADETISVIGGLNTPRKPSSPSSDRPHNLRKRIRASKRIGKPDVGTTEPPVNSSNVEGEWTEMESVVIDEEPFSVKAESPSIWDEDEQEQGSSKELKCEHWPTCGYTTSRPDYMKRHQAVHDSCPGYMKRLQAVQDDIQRLQAVHDDTQRSLTCEKCGKGFTVRQSLNAHMVVHSDGKKSGTAQSPRHRGRRSKDEELAAEYALPVSAKELAAMTYHEVQRLLTDPKLTNAQKALIRKIRRRGRNKLAAQKCRERRAEDRNAPIAHNAQSPRYDDSTEDKGAVKLAS